MIEECCGQKKPCEKQGCDIKSRVTHWRVGVIEKKSIYSLYNQVKESRLNATALSAASTRNVSPVVRCSSLAAALAFAVAVVSGTRLFTLIRSL